MLCFELVYSTELFRLEKESFVLEIAFSFGLSLSWMGRICYI